MIFKPAEYTAYENPQEIHLHLDLPSVLIAVVRELAQMSRRSNTDYFTIRDAFTSEGFVFREKKWGE